MGRFAGMCKRALESWVAVPALALSMSMGCANVDPSQVTSLTCIAGSMLAAGGQNFGKAYLSNAATMMSAFAGVPYGQIGCGNPGFAGRYQNSQYSQADPGYPPQQQYPPADPGYPPQQQYPPADPGYPPQQQYPQADPGYPPQQQYPQADPGYPPQQQYPQADPGYPPQQQYPQADPGYPPQQQYPPADPGYPPQQQYPQADPGYPPQQQYPQANTGYPPQQQYPQADAGYPPQQQYPQADAGYPPQQQYPQANTGYPPQQQYPQADPGYPPQQQYPQADTGYPPQQQYPQADPGYPPQQQYPQADPGYPPQQQYPQAGPDPGYPPQQQYPPADPGYPPQQQPNTAYGYPPPAYGVTGRDASVGSALDIGLFRQVPSEGGAEPALLKSGQVLSGGERGDVFQIYASPSAPTYLYVYAVDATGWIQQLHPSDSTADVSLPAGAELFLPGRDQFYGLDEVPGVQQIFVMASQLARPDIEAQLAHFPLGRARPESALRTRSGEPGYESVTQATVLARGVRRAPAAEVRIPNASGESFERKTPRFLLNPEQGSAVFSMWFRVE